jgi:hypothetical protein
MVKKQMHLDHITPSVLRVGNGRGFVIEGRTDRLIITAAHCLPFFPPCMSFSDLSERTYRKLVAPIDAEPTIWAECLFVDPISDVAILGPPDDQELSKHWEHYNSMLEPLGAVVIADAPAETTGWLLSLDKRWGRCIVRQNGGPLWFSDAAEGIHGGMSGSPVMLDNGKAVGIVCTGGGTGGLDTEGGPNPRLMHNLPGWCLKAITEAA